MRQRKISLSYAVLLTVFVLFTAGAPTASAAEPHPYSLNAAEEAALIRFCAAEADDLLSQLSLAAMMLNRCTDARFPDRLTLVLAEAGYTHAPVQAKAMETAAYAVRLAQMGVDPTGGAVE